MTYCYAIANHKGGVGKTTTAVNLAAALSERARRVLLVDLDPQGHASEHLGLRHPDHEHTEAGLVVSGMIQFPGASPSRTAFGFELLRGGKGTSAAQSMLEGHAEFLGALGRALSAAPGRWDVVLIDTPPQHGRLLQAALRAADGVLVPLELEYLALDGLENLLRTMESERAHNPGLKLAGWFVTNSDHQRLLSRQVLERARGLRPAEELQTVVRRSARIAEAPGWKRPVTVYDEKGAGSADYRALAGELVERGLA